MSCPRKFPEELVREIRRLYASGNMSYRKIAWKVDISHTTVSKICRGKIYADVK